MSETSRVEVERVTDAEERVSTNIRFPRELRDELERRAVLARDSVQGLVLKIVTNYMIEAEPIGKAPPTSGRRLSLPQIAERLEVTPRTAQEWSHDPTFPPPVGRKHKGNCYEEQAVLSWVKTHASQRARAKAAETPAPQAPPTS